MTTSPSRRPYDAGDDRARTPAPRKLQEELLKLSKTERMTAWYDPVKLASTAVDIIVSALVSGRSDFRMIEALAVPQEFFDYIDKPDLWIDYVADVGDGFHSTYSIASLLSRPTLGFDNNLRLAASGNPAGHTSTKRGKILIMGGDEVYPSATRRAYQQRLAKPYQGACWEAKSADAAPIRPRKQRPVGAFPDLFAIPGNHDWYDGLTSFIRLFGQQRTLGVWQTQQKRSYFALRLPHGFWLLGVDIQLESDIDKAQIDYFCEIAATHMKDGDRIVLCTSEPDWVKETMRAKAKHKNAREDDAGIQNNLVFLERELLKQAGFARDRGAHRRRPPPLSTASQAGERHNITAGGGGAFLHPTHECLGAVEFGSEDKPVTYEHKASFPTPEDSRSLAWGNLGLLYKNPGLMPSTAFLYGFCRGS